MGHTIIIWTLNKLFTVFIVKIAMSYTHSLHNEFPVAEMYPSAIKSDSCFSDSGGEWSTSRSSHFTAGEAAHSVHCRGGWEGSRVHVDASEKQTIFCPYQNLNRFLHCPAHILVTIPTVLPVLMKVHIPQT